MTPSSRSMLFAATGPVGREIYSTNGSVGTINLNLDVRPGPDGSGPRELLSWENGKLYFFAWDGIGDSSSRTLWSFEQGSLVEFNLLGGGGRSNLTDWDGQLFFIADTATKGREVWVTDGSARLTAWPAGGRLPCCGTELCASESMRR